MAAPTFEEMEKTASSDLPKGPSFEEMEKTIQPAQPPPQPGLHASVRKDVAPPRTPDWLNYLHNTPVVGDVTRGAEQVINNAGQAMQEFGKDPVSSGMAALGGAASGATGAVEAPAALGTNALASLLIPPGLRTQRQFPGQVAGTPEEQASKVLQQSAAQQSPQYSYNRGMGGVPLADRIQQGTQQAFPNEPGSATTGQVVGGLVPTVPGLGAAEDAGQALFRGLVQNPRAAKALEAIAHHATNHPWAAQMVRGAAEGAAIGEGYQLGEQAARGQPLQPSPVPMLGGALAGAGLRAIGNITGKPKEAITEAPKAEKKIIGQVVKPQEMKATAEKLPKQKTFNSVAEATDAAVKGDPAAVEYLNNAFQKNQQATQEAKEQQLPEQGHIEENIPKEKEIPATTKFQALYEKTGKKPVEIEPTEEEPENEWQQRENVPRDIAESQHQIMDRNTQIGTRDEKGNYIQPGGKMPFDWTNPEPRRGWAIDPRTGEYTRQMIIPSAFDEAGNITHVDLGRKLGKGGAAKEADALRAITEQTHVQGQRRTTEFSPEQQHALDRTIEAIDNNDVPEAQKAAMQKPIEKYKKLSEVTKPEEGTTLYADPLMIGPITNLAKHLDVPLKEAARRFLGEDWKEILGDSLKMHDTMDRIEEGSKNIGDDIHERLWQNLAGEALDTRGLKLEGPFADEARMAMRHLSPDEILDPRNTPNWTDEQREAIATKKVYRMDTKQQIKDTLKKYGDEIDPGFKQALKQYSDNQYGYRGQYKNAPEKMLDAITGHLYQGFFRWNPAFHALVATHPLQMGTSVVGVRNIANAYRLRFGDPEIRDFMGELSTATEDVRTTSAEERFRRQTETDEISKPRTKLMEKDIPTGRINNEVIALGGMLKKGHELYGEGKGEQAVRDLANGTMPKEQQLEMMTAGLQAMRDATGGGTFNINRTMLQDSAYLRTFAQLSGYKHIVARYASKLSQQMFEGKRTNNPALIAAATKSLGTLLGATILMGGHAVIPKEVEEPLFALLGPERMYGIERALDALNVPSKLGVNLQDHIQFSILNWGENVAREAFPELAKSAIAVGKATDPADFANKFANFLGTAFLMTDLAPLGIGMATWNKARQGLHAAREGEKKTSVYSSSPYSPSIYPVGKGTMKYSIGDLLYSIFAPGVESRIGNFRQKKRITALFKKYGGKEPPSTLQQDYPSPGIE